jgi:hypothetical protein
MTFREWFPVNRFSFRMSKYDEDIRYVSDDDNELNFYSLCITTIYARSQMPK